MNGTYYKGLENCPVQVYDDYADASLHAAARIAELVREKKDLVLGLCAGSTPSAVYSELVRLHREEQLSFKSVTVFLIDEYYPLPVESIQGKRYELYEKLFDHIDIPEDQINSLPGSVDSSKVDEACRNYDALIAEVGGIDFMLLGIGSTGHIGANEPGTHFEDRTRRVPLDRVTRISAASEFKGEQNVPRFALTMGLATIMSAKEVLLLAFGEGKASIVRSMIEGEVTKALPASVIQTHPQGTVILDTAAASLLARIKNPWLHSECDWQDEALVRKAVVWLCETTKKPILKLTDRDYMDNGMGDLITLYGSAYTLNIDLFNKIQNTITGWPGGKPGVSDERRPERALPAKKRVVVFSPHPDDDVISMGGTLIRLVDHGHEVHVAYQTNGNLAVADGKVIEIVDLLRTLKNDFGGVKAIDDERLEKMESFLSNRDPLAADSEDVQLIKGLVRKVETMTACRYVGIPHERNHHLDLPFYHTGSVLKKPLSQDDIDIVKNFLQELKPHQIFAAGDLSDPHGTHRVCLNAIFAALDQLRGEEWLKECRVWLYRGAWAEWPVDEAHMAVPISPEELMRKRISIYKHVSQKDGAVFPGSDAREFWQRAEDRNRGTAETYNRLGFAEYEAIELFVRYDLF